jgi:hypothetical protein
MALTVTVTSGYPGLNADTVLSLEVLQALALPNVSVTGAVSTGDLADNGVTFSKLASGIILSAGTVITSLQGSDKLLIGDDSAGGNAVITLANFLVAIHGLGAVSTSFNSWSSDTVLYRQASDGSVHSMSLARFFEQAFTQAPSETSTDDADEVLLHDASAADGSQVVRVTLANVLPNKGTAGTYSSPSSITVDAKGRVTAVATTGETYTVTGIAVPTTAGGSTAASTHGLGAIPSMLNAVLECTTNDAGWVVGDVIPIWMVQYFPGGGSNADLPALMPYATATSLYVVASCIAADMVITPKGGGAARSAFTPGSWRIRWFARK